MKVATCPINITEPAIGVLPCLILNVAALIDNGSINSLKDAVGLVVIVTLSAWLRGKTAITVGGVLSGAEPVVNDQL